MLKYYYIKKIGRSKYTDEELLDNPTLYIVDIENKIMMDILDDIIRKTEDSVNDILDTNKENKYIKLKKDGNDIILENDTYKKDNKLIKTINKYESILFLADYNESYIPLITWLMNQNAREQKHNPNEKHIIKSIDFLWFQIQQKIITKNNTEITNNYMLISDGYYNEPEDFEDSEDSDYTNLKSFSESYQLKNDKYFQYFQTNIHRYKLCTDSLEWIPNHIEYLIINTGSFTQPIDSLPNTLKYLKIKTGKFNQSLDNLPNSLEYLYIQDNEFNQEINFLPFNLKYLFIESDAFNQPLDNLPVNLEILHIDSHSFKHTLLNLPTNLKTLHVSLYLYYSDSNNKIEAIDFTNLPNSLEYLYVNKWTPYSIEKLIIPTNLKEINFPNMNHHRLLEKYPNLKEYDHFWDNIYIMAY